MRFLHWDYFLALEAEFDETTRYVEPAAENYLTYSTAFTRLLLSAGSEVDVVAKVLCNRIDPDSDPQRINEYQPIITGQYSGFCDVHAGLPRFRLELQPWRDWSSEQPPDWWRAYQRVKHDRTKGYADANLANVLGSLGGLFVLLIYVHHDEVKSLRAPALFNSQVFGSYIRTSGVPLPDFEDEKDDS